MSEHSWPGLHRKTPLDVPNQSEPSAVLAIARTAGPFNAANFSSVRMLEPSDESTPSLAVPINKRSSPSGKRLMTSRLEPLGQFRLVRLPSNFSTPRPVSYTHLRA